MSAGSASEGREEEESERERERKRKGHGTQSRASRKKGRSSLVPSFYTRIGFRGCVAGAERFKACVRVSLTSETGREKWRQTHRGRQRMRRLVLLPLVSCCSRCCDPSLLTLSLSPYLMSRRTLNFFSPLLLLFSQPTLHLKGFPFEIRVSAAASVISVREQQQQQLSRHTLTCSCTHSHSLTFQLNSVDGHHNGHHHGSHQDCISTPAAEAGARIFNQLTDTRDHFSLCR